MRSVAVWIVRLLLIATAVTASPSTSAAQIGGSNDERARVLRVWTYMTEPSRPADRDAAEQLARRLLAAAGVAIDWRNCSEANACARDDVAGPSVTLILTSAARPTCGTAALDPAGDSGTVLISVPCIADVAVQLRRRLSTRSNPLLFTLEPQHLLGAAIAHEIGHVLGLPHAPGGLMRARLEIGEVLSLLAGTLTFSPAQSGRMRASTMWPDGQTTRSR